MEERPRKRTDIIRDLVNEGVLGPEEYSIDWNCDRWPVLLPDRLPESIKDLYHPDVEFVCFCEGD